MRQGPSERLASWALLALLVLPWVQPLSSGPSPNAWPWLISAACLAGVLLLRRHLHLRLLAQALLAAALLSCLMALLQYFGRAQALAPWVWPVGPGEGFGNLRQRNQFGSLTAIGLAGLLAWVGSRLREEPRALPPPLVLTALAVLVAGNAASQSRTGLLAWLGVALWFTVFAWRHERRGAALAWLALPLAPAAAVALPRLLALAAPEAGVSCALADCGALGRMAQAGQDSRWPLWANVLALIAQRPWTGWGWGELDYAHFITLFPGERFGEKLGNAHNLPLQLAVELGVPAAALVCAALAAVLWQARPWREARPWRWAAWAVLGVIALHSLLEYPLWYGPFQMAALLCAALLWRTRPGSAVQRGAMRPGLRPDLAAAALLAAVLAVGVDYLRVSQPFLASDARSAWFAGDPLQQARRSWWFRAEADFATLALTPVVAANAPEMNRLAKALLHHSPEPLVIEKLLESSRLLGRADEVAFYARRYEAAYPAQHARWHARQPDAGPPPHGSAAQTP